MRILIIEDEPKMAKLLKKGLQEENHSVMVAHDGMEGFDMSRTDEFDAVVLDVMLPGMTGFEIARRLRDSNSQVPILMLTARDAVAAVRWAAARRCANAHIARLSEYSTAHAPVFARCG
jgi:DNA-binding response OmpR family regulator